MSETTNKSFPLSKPAIIVISTICILAVVLGCVFGIKCTVTLEHFCPAPENMEVISDGYLSYHGSISLNNSTKTIVEVTRTSRFTPYIPYRSGYTFCGWYRDSGFSIPWISGDKVSHDITLYAKWEKSE